MISQPPQPSILYETLEAGIVKVTLNRPEVLNALNWEAMQHLEQVIEEASATPGLRALLLTGAGARAFCAGGDLAELDGYRSEADGRRLSETMTRTLDKLASLPVPTIALVNGHARGGGAEISLACDLRLVAENATLGFTQVAIGLSPGWGGSTRLLQLIGYPRAFELLTSARILTAAECLQVGIANSTYPQEQLQSEGLTLARQVAEFPPRAVQSIKYILKEALRSPSAGMAAENQIFPALWDTEEHHTLIDKFLNRKRA